MHFPLAKSNDLYYNMCTLNKFCFCHAACGSCAAERREPCQAGNRAALSGLPVRHSPPVRRVTEAEFFY